MHGVDSFRLGRQVFIVAWVIAKVDSMFGTERRLRLPIQTAVFFGGLGLLWRGLDKEEPVLTALGFLLPSLSAIFGLTELVFCGLASPVLKAWVVQSILKQLHSTASLRGSLIAARLDHAVGEWLSRNCPSLNFAWVRDALESSDLG